MLRNQELDAADRRPRSSGVGRRARSLTALLAVSSLAAGAAIIVAAVDASAAPSDPVPTPAAATVSLSGVTSADAAASCWEIKQRFPDSPDGVYWLRNSELPRPERFHCDMTTDGGGWVMIGRGRDGWTFQDYGQSTPHRLVDAIDGPEAFAPAALSSEMIDALLGGDVKDLADGLRIRRATNTTGTQWQEMRWQFRDLTSWSWALDGGHRLAAFSIDGLGGTGSNTKDSSTTMWGEVGTGNRAATNHDGWFTYPWSGHGRQAGFSYRGSIDGERNDTSYLWEYDRENSALPFTQLYLRPMLTTGPSTEIPDEGLPAEVLAPLLDDRPEEIAGGVVGLNSLGDSEPALRAPVLDITSLGDRLFVGGKFSDVRDTSTGELVAHSYLAAFDRRTGAWIPSFRPQLDGTVWDLEVVDGRLIAAGQFTNVNDVAGTQGLAAIDPITGQVDPSWRASLTVSGTAARPIAFSIDREGDSIYVGGNFTQIAGPTRTLRMGRLAKVSVANGDPDRAFRPNVDGVPFDVDAAGETVHVVGRFNGVNGDARRSIATVTADTGQVVSGLADPVWTTTNNSRRYQFAVLDLGDEVWNGGSEHDTQVYRDSDYQFLRGFATAGQGGDTQVLELSGDKVMQGSHGNSWIYTDATTWPALANFTRADVYNWLGMFDPVTHEYERDWVPGLGSAYTAGVWALHTDAAGCLWFGGDTLGGPYVNGQRQYLESFSKFCPRDTTAPTVPLDAAASTQSDGGVRLTWRPSTDNEPGFLGYEVLRNDRVVSPLLYASSYVDPAGTPNDRYFVRAVDPAGNRSATTPSTMTPMVPPPSLDTQNPSTPRDLVATVSTDGSIDVSWSASRDNVGVAYYRVTRNNVEVVLVESPATSVNVTTLGPGTHYIAVQAFDAAGNSSWKTPTVAAVIPASPTSTVPPTTAPPATAPPTTAPPATRPPPTTAPPPSTPPTTRPPSLDTRSPSTPRDLVAMVLADYSIDVSWSASRDNVGVAYYRVTRNNAEVVLVPGTRTSVNVTTLGFGTHYVAVQAFDAAGNSSWKTPTVTAVVVPPPSLDTWNPSTPRDLVATVSTDGSIDVSWSASRDNVGVAYYRVTRNNVEVVLVESPATSVNVTTLGPGTHYIAVQAFDVAGNSSWKTPTVTAVVP